jgi:hypothetical protein
MVLVVMVVSLSRNVHWEVDQYWRGDSVSRCILMLL